MFKLNLENVIMRAALNFYFLYKSEKVAWCLKHLVNILQKSREYVDRMLSYLNQLRQHVVESVKNSVAPCRPLWEIFNSTRLFLCRHTMDPLVTRPLLSIRLYTGEPCKHEIRLTETHFNPKPCLNVEFCIFVTMCRGKVTKPSTKFVFRYTTTWSVCRRVTSVK